MKRELRIETPEGIVFSFTLASPVARWMAWLIDGAVIFAAVYVLGRVTPVFGLLNKDWGGAVSTIAYFVVSLGYPMAFEWYGRGQTLGKRVLHLRVVDAAGFRLKPWQVILRNLLRAIDMLPMFYCVGGAACLISAKGQRLGDLAANTIVLRELPSEEPQLDRAEGSKYNSLAAYPHITARLRGKIPAKAAAIAVEALVQRAQYDPAARLVLFQELAGYFKELAAFPVEAVEGLTDEQYVRNVVALLYSR